MRCSKHILRIIVISIMFILACGMAQAATLAGYYQCEDNVLDSSGNANNGINNGVTFSPDVPNYNKSGSGGTKSCYFDGTAKMNLTGLYDDMSKTSGTIALWVRDADLAQTGKYIVGHFATVDSSRIYMYLTGANLYYRLGTSSGVDSTYDFTSTASWSYVVLDWNSGTSHLYVNNTLKHTGAYAGLNTLANTFYLGESSAGSNGNPKMYVDDARFYNGVLTATERQNLFNCNLLTACPEIKFELALENSYNLSPILSFTANFTNSSNPTGTTISTTNGTIYYHKGQTVDIFLSNIAGNTYFNRTYYSVDTNSNLRANAFQSVVRMYTNNLDNSTLYTDINYTLYHNVNLINVSRFINDGVTTETTFNVTSGTYNYTALKSGYPQAQGQFTLSPLDNITIYATMGMYAQLNLIDEATKLPFNISRTNKTTAIVTCDTVGSYEYALNASTQNITIPCSYTRISVRVTYYAAGVTEEYTRTLLSSETSFFDIDIYLVDLTTTDSLENFFILNDYAGRYINPKIYILKDIDGSRVTIHSDKLDISNKMTTYLISNDVYTLELRSDNLPVNTLGFYGADIAGSQEITVTTSNFDSSPPTVLGDGITISTFASGANNTLAGNAFYADELSNTDSISWALDYYNDTNLSFVQFYTTTSIATYGNLTFTPYNMSKYANFTILSTISYIQDGVTSEFSLVIYTAPIDLTDDTMFEFFTSLELRWGVVIFLSIISLLGTITTQTYVNYVVIAIAAVFQAFNLTAISIVIIIMSLVINFMFHLKTEDKQGVYR